jgi:hypothetical protein
MEHLKGTSIKYVYDRSQCTNIPNKLECLTVAGFSNFILVLWERPGVYPRMKYMKDTSLG